MGLPSISPLLQKPLKPLNDAEGDRLARQLPEVVDAHVHLFPEGLFRAVWDWFDQHGWPIRYRLNAPQILDFLFQRGISHVVGLQYAHKAGMAEELNRLMIGWMAEYPRLVGLATCFPGEPDADAILQRGFDQGLKGVKLHVHVQGFELDNPEMDPIYRVCCDNDRPLLMHAGREPKSPAYQHDPYALCSTERVERVLQRYPDLKLCVPHMGLGESPVYAELIERYNNLWLDTTMALSNYFDETGVPDLRGLRLERIMYGSDFPNIPYAWDREINAIADRGLNAGQLEQIFAKTARGFYAIDSE